MEPHREASPSLPPIEPSSPVLPTSELSPPLASPPPASTPTPPIAHSSPVLSNPRPSSPNTSPPSAPKSSPPGRTPLPTIWDRVQVKRKLTKTEKEKARGDRLKKDNEGVNATTPCETCFKLGRTCRVARDPSKFNSYKCGECIKAKCKCTFGIENPGINYGSHDKKKNKAREQGKRRARIQALVTKRKNSADTESPEILGAAEALMSMKYAK